MDQSSRNRWNDLNNRNPRILFFLRLLCQRFHLFLWSGIIIPPPPPPSLFIHTGSEIRGTLSVMNLQSDAQNTWQLSRDYIWYHHLHHIFMSKTNTFLVFVLQAWRGFGNVCAKLSYHLREPGRICVVLAWGLNLLPGLMNDAWGWKAANLNWRMICKINRKSLKRRRFSFLS